MAAGFDIKLPGSYGEMRLPSIFNIPSARSGMSGCFDASTSQMWMFGGSEDMLSSSVDSLNFWSFIVVNLLISNVVWRLGSLRNDLWLFGYNLQTPTVATPQRPPSSIVIDVPVPSGSSTRTPVASASHTHAVTSLILPLLSVSLLCLISL